MIPTYQVCGIPIAALTPAQAAEVVVEQALARRSVQAHLCNAYTLSLVGSDARLRSALLAADLNLPDGAPVAWLGRRFGTAGPVRGPGLVVDVARAGVPGGVRHYLYGGWDGIAEAMAATLLGMAPGAVIAASETPPYGDADEAHLDGLGERIRASGAHIVWVGLGTPRQDYAVPAIAARVEAVVVPIGAAFDVHAGSVKQAPKFLHGSGLEWTYRLATEPRRLWRRYLLGNPRFVAAAIRHRKDDRS